IEQELSEDERLCMTIPVFLEGVTIHQKHDLYLHKDDEASTEQGDAILATLTLPQALEKKGGISKLDTFSGIYQQEDLVKYFKSLRQILEEDTPFPHPMSFILASSNHAISVGYDPKKKNWVLINAMRISCI